MGTRLETASFNPSVEDSFLHQEFSSRSLNSITLSCYRAEDLTSSLQPLISLLNRQTPATQFRAQLKQKRRGSRLSPRQDSSATLISSTSALQVRSSANRGNFHQTPAGFRSRGQVRYDETSGNTRSPPRRHHSLVDKRLQVSRGYIQGSTACNATRIRVNHSHGKWVHRRGTFLGNGSSPGPLLWRLLLE